MALCYLICSWGGRGVTAPLKIYRIPSGKGAGRLSPQGRELTEKSPWRKSQAPGPSLPICQEEDITDAAEHPRGSPSERVAHGRWAGARHRGKA